MKDRRNDLPLAGLVVCALLITTLVLDQRPVFAEQVPGALLGHDSFASGTEGWTAEGGVTISSTPRQDASIYGTAPLPDGTERALKISTIHGGGLARSPQVPVGTEHIVWHFESTHAFVPAVLEARGSADEVILTVGVNRGQFVVTGSTSQTFGSAWNVWHRLDVKIIDGAYEVTVDQTASIIVAPAVVAELSTLVVRPRTDFPVWLDDIRFHASGGTREDIFSLGGPAEGFQAVSTDSAGAVSYLDASSSGFYDKGKLSVRESLAEGGRHFISCSIDDLGSSFMVGVGFRPLGLQRLRGPMALAAGIDRADDSKVHWAVVIRPVVPDVYRLSLISAGSEIPLPGVVRTGGDWYSLRVRVDVEGRQLEISWDGGHLKTSVIDGIELVDAVAFGDLSGDPVAGDPLTPPLPQFGGWFGVLQFDDVFAVPTTVTN